MQNIIYVSVRQKLPVQFCPKDWCTQSHLGEVMRKGGPVVRGGTLNRDGGTPLAKHKTRWARPPHPKKDARGGGQNSSGLPTPPTAGPAQAVRRARRHGKTKTDSAGCGSRSHLVLCFARGVPPSRFSVPPRTTGDPLPVAGGEGCNQSYGEGC